MITVWTNGCFDILHRGHIELFKHAKSLGHELYVGIDSDEKVKADKGWDRPYNNQEDRKVMLESIKYIDKVGDFESALLAYFDSEKADLKKQINDTGDWDDGIEKQFKELVEDFKKTQTY